MLTYLYFRCLSNSRLRKIIRINLRSLIFLRVLYMRHKFQKNVHRPRLLPFLSLQQYNANNLGIYASEITGGLFSSPGHFIRKTYIFRLSGPRGDRDLSTLTRLGIHFTYVCRTFSPFAPSRTQGPALSARTREFVRRCERVSSLQINDAT